MSLIFAALPRSERLLPVESEATVRRATRCRVLFLSADKNPGLYEHVAFYTEAEQLARRRQRRWSCAVGSVKVPVRLRGFPPCAMTMSTACAQHKAEHSRKETAAQQQVVVGRRPLSTSADVVPQSPWLPRLTVLRLCTTLLAPYEALLCPNLLCSPLLPPMLDPIAPSRTSHKNNEYNDDDDGEDTTVRAMAETMTSIARLSAEAAVPVQEALLFFSLCLVYLELCIPCAHPCCWDSTRCQAQGLSSSSSSSSGAADVWLTCHIGFNEEHDEGSSTAGRDTRQQGDSSSSAAPPLSWHRPGSVHELSAKLRDCLRYYDAMAPDILAADTAHTSEGKGEEEAAAEKEKDAAAWELRTHRHHLPLRLLHLAAREWARRRESTVTASHPTGCAAVALAPRDLHRSESDAPLGTPYNSSSTVSRLEHLFEPYEPHDTAASQHAFHLPPLPCDPHWLVFVPLWQSLLQRCMTDRHELLHVRERALRALALRCRHLTQQCASPSTTTSTALCTLVHSEAACRRLTGCRALHFFTVYAPQSGTWCWNTQLGWLGFEGVLCALLRPATSATSDNTNTSSSSGGSTSERLVRSKPNTRRPEGNSERSAMRRFVDPALRLTASDLTVSVEELTDYLCRLGAPLPRGLLGSAQHHMLILARHQVQYITRVLQRGVLDLYLACTRSRIEEMRLRPTFRGLVLTCVQESGAEVRLCAPGQLASYVYPTSTADAQAITSSGGSNTAAVRYGPAALRIVAEAGYEEAMALVQFLRSQCSGAASATQRGMVRNIPLYTAQQRQRLQPNNNNQHHHYRNGGTSPLPTVQALLLSRAEEAVLLRILQCHPHALYLIGCGVQQLMLRVSDGQPLLQRSCGMVIEWDLRACYAGPQLRQLRSPRRVVRADSNSSPPPQALLSQVPDLSDRTPREKVRAMMWHYYRSLTQSLAAADKTTTTTSTNNSAAASSSVQAAKADEQAMKMKADHEGDEAVQHAFRPRTTLFPVDRAVALYVLRHHPHYYSQLRGCGIAEVYIAADTTREGRRSAQQTAPTSRAIALASTSHDGMPHTSHTQAAEDSTSSHTEAAATTATANEDAACDEATVQPTFVLERVCGRLVGVGNIDACYSALAPHALLPQMVLAAGQDMAGAEAEYKRGRECTTIPNYGACLPQEPHPPLPCLSSAAAPCRCGCYSVSCTPDPVAAALPASSPSAEAAVTVHGSSCVRTPKTEPAVVASCACHSSTSPSPSSAVALVPSREQGSASPLLTRTDLASDSTTLLVAPSSDTPTRRSIASRSSTTRRVLHKLLHPDHRRRTTNTNSVIHVPAALVVQKMAAEARSQCNSGCSCNCESNCCRRSMDVSSHPSLAGCHHMFFSFYIDGMSCAACANRTRQALQALAGVSDVCVDFASRRADVTMVVEGGSAMPQLIQCVEGLGYRIRATPPSAGLFAARANRKGAEAAATGAVEEGHCDGNDEEEEVEMWAGGRPREASATHHTNSSAATTAMQEESLVNTYSEDMDVLYEAEMPGESVVALAAAGGKGARDTAGEASEQMGIATTSILVEGMSCGSCAARIEAALARLPGVRQASVNFATLSGKVVHETARVSVEQLLHAVKKLGYRGTLQHTTANNSNNSKGGSDGTNTIKAVKGTQKKAKALQIHDKGDENEEEEEEEEMCTLHMTIEGLRGPEEAAKLEHTMQGMAHVQACVVSAETGTAVLILTRGANSHEASEAIDKAMRAAGLRVTERRSDAQPADAAAIAALAANTEDGNGEVGNESAMAKTRAALERTAEIRVLRHHVIGSAILCVPLLVAMVLMSFTEILHHNLPLNQLVDIVQLMCASQIVFYFGANFFVSAWRSARHMTFTMDTLVALGIGCSYVYSAVVLFISVMTQTHQMTYFDTAGTLTTFMLLGRLLEAQAKRSTSGALTELMGLVPPEAIIVTGSGADVRLPSASIKVGMRVRVLAGARIPVDGTVLEGMSDVDEQMVTGESLPKAVKPGSAVVGGTLNITANLVLVADKVGSETVLAQIVRIVQEAQNTKPAVQRIADRIAMYFVPFVILFALLTLAVWLILGYTKAYPDRWLGEDGSRVSFAFNFFIATVVAACPCALGLATPTAIMVGTGVGARSGVLVKSGVTLEAVRTIRCVVLDKTGTLTNGALQVVAQECSLAEPAAVRRAFRLVAAVEALSNHPIAKAVSAALQQPPPQQQPHEVNDTALAGDVTEGWVEVRSVRTMQGMGVDAAVEYASQQQKEHQRQMHRVLVGNLALMERSQVSVSVDIAYMVSQFSASGYTTVVGAVDGLACVVLALSDEPKPEAYQVIQHLHAQGIRTMMVTGDHRSVAMRVAHDIGMALTDVHAEALPGTKVAILQQLQREGTRVMFVGDGINDSPALTQADVGVALGAGTEIAVEAADAVLVHNSLVDLLNLYALSRTTVRRIYGNFIWAFVYNTVMLPMASGALFPLLHRQLPPVIAGAAMVLSSLSVLTSSLSIRCFRPYKEEAFTGHNPID